MTEPVRVRTLPTAAPAATGLTRRDVLKTAAAGGLFAMPDLVPARALGREGTVPPSERILLGGIGLGGRGRTVLSGMLDEPDVRFLAICDLSPSRRALVKNMVDRKYANRDCATYRDLRELLAVRTDLDAMLLATEARLRLPARRETALQSLRDRHRRYWSETVDRPG